MRTVFLFMLITLVPTAAAAHPGKTDRHGGHQCLKECAEWDLYYREYHTHDKDGRTIRTGKQRPVSKQMVRSAPMAPPEPEEGPAAVPPTAPAPAPLRASVVPVEPDDPTLSWSLLALLLLLLLAVRRRLSRAGAKNAQ